MNVWFGKVVSSLSSADGSCRYIVSWSAVYPHMIDIAKCQ